MAPLWYQRNNIHININQSQGAECRDASFSSMNCEICYYITPVTLAILLTQTYDCGLSIIYIRAACCRICLIHKQEQNIKIKIWTTINVLYTFIVSLYVKSALHACRAWIQHFNGFIINCREWMAVGCKMKAHHVFYIVITLLFTSVINTPVWAIIVFLSNLNNSVCPGKGFQL